MSYSVYLPNYSIGEDCYKEIPAVARRYGKKAVVIGGKTAMSKAKQALLDGLKESDMEITDFIWYGGDSSYENGDALIADKTVQDADIIFGVGGGKALVFVVLSDEGLDDALVGQVLLNLVVQAVHLILHSGKAREADADDDELHHHDQRHRDRQHRGQRRAHGDGGDQRADEHARRAQAHAHEHVDHVHDLGHVVGQAGDEGGGGEAVDVGEGEPLNLRVHVAAHVGGHVDRGLGGEVRAAHAAGHHQQRRQNHQQAGDDDVAHVARLNAHVDDVGVQLGQHDLADDLDDHAQRPDDEIQRVGPGVSEPSFQIGTHPFGCWNYERFFSPSALQA